MKKIIHKIHLRKNIFLTLFFGAVFFSVDAQQITPFVVNSTGNFSSGGGISISSSVGEAITTSLFNSSYILTQGFQQPAVQSAFPLAFYVSATNESCTNANDGSATVHITNGVAPYSYLWMPNGMNTDSVANLQPGTYTVKVTDADSISKTDTIIIAVSQEVCAIHIYTGITPNGDGHNDYWQIDNIELHPNNNVMIFNRWGSEVWKANSYNNNNVSWKGENEQGKPLPDGTYFYVLKMDTKTYKGWIQLTR